MAAVYCAERLNALAARHWRSFAGQPYFDEHGIFTSAVYSVPLLVVMFVILVRVFFVAGRLMRWLPHGLSKRLQPPASFAPFTLSPSTTSLLTLVGTPIPP